MNVSNPTSVNAVADAPQAVARAQQPAAPDSTRQKQDSAVVKLSEQAQQANRAENQKNAKAGVEKTRESKDSSAAAAAARSAEAAKAHAAQAETNIKRVNTFA